MNDTTLLRAGMVAGIILKADPDSKIIITKPETHNYILSTPRDDGLGNHAFECIELRKWTNGKEDFHIGYSRKQRVIIVAFPETL